MNKIQLLLNQLRDQWKGQLIYSFDPIIFHLLQWMEKRGVVLEQISQDIDQLNRKLYQCLHQSVSERYMEILKLFPDDKIIKSGLDRKEFQSALNSVFSKDIHDCLVKPQIQEELYAFLTNQTQAKTRVVSILFYPKQQQNQKQDWHLQGAIQQQQQTQGPYQYDQYTQNQGNSQFQENNVQFYPQTSQQLGGQYVNSNVSNGQYQNESEYLNSLNLCSDPNASLNENHEVFNESFYAQNHQDNLLNANIDNSFGKCNEKSQQPQKKLNFYQQQQQSSYLENDGFNGADLQYQNNGSYARLDPLNEENAVDQDQLLFNNNTNPGPYHHHHHHQSFQTLNYLATGSGELLDDLNQNDPFKEHQSNIPSYSSLYNNVNQVASFSEHPQQNQYLNHHMQIPPQPVLNENLTKDTGYIQKTNRIQNLNAPQSNINPKGYQNEMNVQTNPSVNILPDSQQVQPQPKQRKQNRASGYPDTSARQPQSAEQNQVPLSSNNTELNPQQKEQLSQVSKQQNLQNAQQQSINPQNYNQPPINKNQPLIQQPLKKKPTSRRNSQAQIAQIGNVLHSTNIQSDIGHTQALQPPSSSIMNIGSNKPLQIHQHMPVNENKQLQQEQFPQQQQIQSMNGYSIQNEENRYISHPLQQSQKQHEYKGQIPGNYGVINNLRGEDALKSSYNSSGGGLTNSQYNNSQIYPTRQTDVHSSYQSSNVSLLPPFNVHPKNSQENIYAPNSLSHQSNINSMLLKPQLNSDVNTPHSHPLNTPSYNAQQNEQVPLKLPLKQFSQNMMHPPTQMQKQTSQHMPIKQIPMSIIHGNAQYNYDQQQEGNTPLGKFAQPLPSQQLSQPQLQQVQQQQQALQQKQQQEFQQQQQLQLQQQQQQQQISSSDFNPNIGQSNNIQIGLSEKQQQQMQLQQNLLQQQQQNQRGQTSSHNNNRSYHLQWDDLTTYLNNPYLLDDDNRGYEVFQVSKSENNSPNGSNMNESTSTTNDQRQIGQINSTFPPPFKQYTPQNIYSHNPYETPSTILNTSASNLQNQSSLPTSHPPMQYSQFKNFIVLLNIFSLFINHLNGQFPKILNE